MTYNPRIHHRRSIRLKGYDYSQSGLYFITICTQGRAYLFGEIRMYEHLGKQIMILNDAGEMIKHWYYELQNKFPDIICHNMVIMPNHIHFIIEKRELESEKTTQTIGNVIQWFKTMTTNHYIRGVKQKNWPPFNGKLWLRNYYDQIIHDAQSYDNIANYIDNNPAKWDINKYK